MRILVVYNEPALQLALAAQWQARGHSVLGITPSELQNDMAAHLAVDDDDADCFVIDCASRDSAADGSAIFDEHLFQRLADHCRQQDFRLLLLSDSRVFGTGNKQRYRESEAAQPNGAVGTRLSQREQYIAAQVPRHIILRTGPLIASSGINLLTDLLLRFRHGGTLSVSGAPRFNPTPVADVARVISGIYDQLDCAAQCWGIYHYHSSDAASGYEFAEVVLAAAAQYWDVGGSHAQLQAVVEEPFGGVFPTLNCQHIRDTFGIQQLPWRKAIPQLLKTIYADELP